MEAPLTGGRGSGARRAVQLVHLEPGGGLPAPGHGCRPGHPVAVVQRPLRRPVPDPAKPLEPVRPVRGRRGHDHRHGADHRVAEHRPVDRVDPGLHGHGHGPAPGGVAPRPVGRGREPAVHLDHRGRRRPPSRGADRRPAGIRDRLHRCPLLRRHPWRPAHLARSGVPAGEWPNDRPTRPHIWAPRGRAEGVTRRDPELGGRRQSRSSPSATVFWPTGAADADMDSRCARSGRM